MFFFWGEKSKLHIIQASEDEGVGTGDRTTHIFWIDIHGNPEAVHIELQFSQLKSSIRA